MASFSKMKRFHVEKDVEYREMHIYMRVSNTSRSEQNIGKKVERV